MGRSSVLGMSRSGFCAEPSPPPPPPSPLAPPTPPWWRSLMICTHPAGGVAAAHGSGWKGHTIMNSLAPEARMTSWPWAAAAIGESHDTCTHFRSTACESVCVKVRHILRAMPRRSAIIRRHGGCLGVRCFTIAPPVMFCQKSFRTRRLEFEALLSALYWILVCAISVRHFRQSFCTRPLSVHPT